MKYTIAEAKSQSVVLYIDVTDTTNVFRNLETFNPQESTLQVINSQNGKSRYFIVYKNNDLTAQLLKMLFQEKISALNEGEFGEPFLRALIEEMKSYLQKYHLLGVYEQSLQMDDNNILFIFENKVYVLDIVFILSNMPMVANFTSVTALELVKLAKGNSLKEKVEFLQSVHNEKVGNLCLFGNTKDEKGITLAFRGKEKVIPWEEFVCRY